MANAELSGIFSSVTASEAWFVMLEKISDSNVCSRRLRREQTWSNAQLGIRAAAGGANVPHKPPCCLRSALMRLLCSSFMFYFSGDCGVKGVSPLIRPNTKTVTRPTTVEPPITMAAFSACRKMDTMLVTSDKTPMHNPKICPIRRSANSLLMISSFWPFHYPYHACVLPRLRP